MNYEQIEKFISEELFNLGIRLGNYAYIVTLFRKEQKKKGITKIECVDNMNMQIHYWLFTESDKNIESEFQNFLLDYKMSKLLYEVSEEDKHLIL